MIIYRAIFKSEEKYNDFFSRKKTVGRPKGAASRGKRGREDSDSD
jgi:hypothetical protein